MCNRRLLAALAMALLMNVAIGDMIHDPTQRAAFVKEHPCPATEPHTKASCPGFVVGHIKALACGGADRPENMQWQTLEEAKARDKIERLWCDVDEH